MKNTYLIALLHKLNATELEECARFVRSPYFNYGPLAAETLELLDILLEQAPAFEGEHISRAAVIARMYPKTGTRVERIDKIMSELARLIRLYLQTSHYWRQENRFQQQLDWAELTRKMGLVSRYHQAISKAEAVLKEEKWESAQLYQRYFLLEFEKSNWQSATNQSKSDLNISATIHYLEVFYLLHRLELLNRLLIQQRLITLEDSPEFERLVAGTTVPPELARASTLLHIKEKIFDLLKKEEPTAEEFYQLFNSVAEREQALDPDALRTIYTYLRSLCVLKIYNGADEFTPVLFDIQKNNIENGFLLHQGEITASAYLSVARNALLTGHHEWALHFIEKYKDCVFGEQNPGECYHLNLSYYLFYKKKYGEALDLIPQNFQFMEYQLAAKRLEIMIYYELDSDLLLYKIDAFKMFVSRTGRKLLSEAHKTVHGNFVNFAFQLAQSIRGDRKRSEQLQHRIRDKKHVAERTWLLEKARLLGAS